MRKKDKNSILNLEKKSKFNTNTSFHESIKYILVFSQFFGVLNVQNVTDRDERNLKFSWKSKRTIYAMLFLVCGSCESAMALRRLFHLGFNLYSAETLFFFVTSIVRAFLFFRITLNWKEIMEYWKNCEAVFLRQPYFEKEWKLEKKCKLIFIILVIECIGKLLWSFRIVTNVINYFVCMFVGPHIFFLAASIYDNYMQLENCPHQISDFWQNYLAHYRSHLLYHIPYSPFLLPLYEVRNFGVKKVFF